jgi:hypothetical protein
MGKTRPVSEAQLQTRIIEYAQWMKWRVVHIRAARRQDGWTVPYEGDPGLPDLILARNGRVLLAELKREGESPTSDQAKWLAAAGPNGRLWRPSDWATIVEELR